MNGHSPDPRARALADYLRQRAAAFSLSADATGGQHIASAGMALLDAAALVEAWPTSDARLEEMTRAGRFETMPEGGNRFVETSDLRAVIQRPLSGSSMSGRQVLDLIVATACGQ